MPYSCISPWSAQKTRPLVQDWLAWPLPRREEVYGMVSRKAHTCTYIHSIGCPRNTYTSLPLSPDLSLSLSLVSGCLPPGRYQLDTASPLPSRHGQVVASSEQTIRFESINQNRPLWKWQLLPCPGSHRPVRHLPIRFPKGNARFRTTVRRPRRAPNLRTHDALATAPFGRSDDRVLGNTVGTYQNLPQHLFAPTNN